MQMCTKQGAVDEIFAVMSSYFSKLFQGLYFK